MTTLNDHLNEVRRVNIHAVRHNHDGIQDFLEGTCGSPGYSGAWELAGLLTAAITGAITNGALYIGDSIRATSRYKAFPAHKPECPAHGDNNE